jgi:hypothetical protein
MRESIRTLLCLSVCNALFTAGGCGTKDAAQVHSSVDVPASSAGAEAQRRSSPAPEPGGIASKALGAPSKRSEGATLFELLPSEHTGINFQMTPPDIEKNVREVVHLNVNGGICTGDFDNDGLADFYVTSPSGGCRLYRNTGDFRFVDVTVQAGVDDPSFWATGATFVDIDNDGDLDLYACGYRRPNRLYINERRRDGKVQFQERSHSFGLDFKGASMTMAFADMDNDGDLDGYLATTAQAPPPGVKFQVRFEGNKPVVLQQVREYWELIYLPGDRAFRTEAGQFDHLYRNDGHRFTEVTRLAGIDGAHFTLSATWWDYNQDGFPDLYAANDFYGPDRLYHNNGDGTFTDVSKDLLPHTPWFSMGTDLGDVNNDGLIDFLATDMLARTHHREQVMRGNMAQSDWFSTISQPRQYVRNALFLSTGAGRMLEAAFQTNTAATDWTWNPRLADFDNDGRLDLFITNGVVRDTMNSDLGAYADSHFTPNSPEWSRFWAQQEMLKEPNVALKNLGDLQFEDVGEEWGLNRVGVSFGAATADFDNDGDLDLVVNDADSPLSIYRNGSDTGHRVRVRLHGQSSNRFGVGARIELVAGGLRQACYVTLARGWLSAVEPVTTFGLGEAKKIDELTVTWPSGHQQKFTDLKADQLHVIAEPAGAPAAPPQAKAPVDEERALASTALFEPDAAFPEIEHRETPFDDFAQQPLLPFKLSESGPVMEWADVDGNGHEDVYVGGAKGVAGRLFVNSASGEFNERAVPAFDHDRDCEDTDAVFVDADGDGDRDLFVVSGSVEHEPDHAAYRDRLYFNDGKGGFTKAADDALPDLRDSGSVAAACDFDKDGDEDLFVGNRCLPGQYPLPPKNHLLVNNKGQFQDGTPEAIGDAGMAIDAVWSDVNDDGWQDLMLTTDWGPVRLFANQNGQLVEKTAEAGLAERLGWWKAIAAGDFDEDGDADFVATNVGRNTKYRATAEKPELLLYGDMDGSGRPQLIEARYEGSTLYPRRDLKALATAMPSLQASFDSFDKFGRASLADVFSRERLEQAQRWTVNTLESGVLVNEGQFRFRFEPLPALAQIAPSLGVDVGDVDGDGHLDIIMPQNFFSAHPTTGQMDGGVSLLMVGNGEGKFEPVWPNRSGIVVPGEAREVKIVELDGDGRPDVVVAVQNGVWRAYRNRSERLRTAAEKGAGPIIARDGQ